MIVFRGLRVGSVALAMAGHLPSAAAAPLRRRTGRQAALTPSGGREKRPFGRPCTPFGRRRAALVMRQHHGGPRS